MIDNWRSDFMFVKQLPRPLRINKFRIRIPFKIQILFLSPESKWMNFHSNIWVWKCFLPQVDLFIQRSTCLTLFYRHLFRNKKVYMTHSMTCNKGSYITTGIYEKIFACLCQLFSNFCRVIVNYKATVCKGLITSMGFHVGDVAVFSCVQT